MERDVALFDAAFFNLASDVASVSDHYTVLPLTYSMLIFIYPYRA